jgi:regulatory helix-turn-helix LysR family protein
MNRTLSVDFLRTFVAIADAGTFAAAVERVGRTLSAVSLQIDRSAARCSRSPDGGWSFKLKAPGALPHF